MVPQEEARSREPPLDCVPPFTTMPLASGLLPKLKRQSSKVVQSGEPNGVFQEGRYLIDFITTLFSRFF
jgi:hypothetical protein